MVILVKYWFTKISTLVVFKRYLTDANWNIFETYIIGNVAWVSFNYRFIPFSILGRSKQYLTNTYQYILKSNIIGCIG